jgi:hypothetical protein
VISNSGEEEGGKMVDLVKGSVGVCTRVVCIYKYVYV